MTEQVARALCDAAGRSSGDALNRPGPMQPDCSMCDGGECTMWTSFRQEAQAAIKAAYQWHKKERRWPAFALEAGT